jgi:arabinoxylan arabinofuranohydrolase
LSLPRQSLHKIEMKMLSALLFAQIVGGCVANLVAFSLRFTADPAPLVVGDRVYLYTTHDATNQSGYSMYDYSLISSVDLLNWLDHGLVFDARNVSWGERGAWAQQTIGPIDGSDGNGGTCLACYYMYWPNVVNSSRNGSVGVALSRNATGPFVDVTPGGVPLMPGDDPTVYREPSTGAVYLCSNHYFVPLCGKLASDMLSWELAPRNISGLPHWYEAPWLMQQPPLDQGSRGSSLNGTFLMSYECPSRLDPPNATYPLGHYGLDICQAACFGVSCPLDGWEFLPDSELMWSPPLAAGNNHGGLFQFAGRWYYAYHTGALAVSRGISDVSLQRSVALDAAYPILGGLAFLPVTATPDWLQQTSWVSPYASVGGIPGALSASASSGVDTVALPAGETTRAVLLPIGGWLRVAGVDFGRAGVVASALRVRGALQSGSLGTPGSATLSIVLDSIAAQPVATCTLSASWNTALCSGSPSNASLVKGVHDVYLVASAADGCTATTSGGCSVLVSWWSAGDSGIADSAPPLQPLITCTAIRSHGTGLLLTSPPSPSDNVTATATEKGSRNYSRNFLLYLRRKWFCDCYCDEFFSDVRASVHAAD